MGHTDAASRKLADQIPSVTRDPDYGRMNHGITIGTMGTTHFVPFFAFRLPAWYTVAG